ncbi:AraC family transcriptional regulator [Yoonia sp. BS5-3]|uniref:Helix-turn-helix domain-containing protein n=1 Tax=Yoonia phaeophyticola TaxID=3137369 RepID=A0ABZ2V4Y0_9RHOB
MDNAIGEMIGLATLAIALFGALSCVMQAQFRTVSYSFALFLVAVALNNAPQAFSNMLTAWGIPPETPLLFSLNLTTGLCLAPFFWFYVFTLTSTDQKPPARLWRHLILPAIALIPNLCMIFVPTELWLAIMDGDEAALSSLGLVLLVVVLSLLDLAIVVQIAVYLFFILRRLTRYRARLRDVYASTEEHELRWIYLIGILGIIFWLAQLLMVGIALGVGGGMAAHNGFLLAGFALFAVMTFWGLRQRPPLAPAEPDTPPLDPPSETPAKDDTEKYQKSALNAEAAARIARKLRAAMEIDHLYRDPNLSLWALASHVGATPNYISQTLNEVIGESFFDFVNRHRIAEAMELLTQSDETVLNITYDVGFNARSSFYTAFKKVTGQTPSSYRKSMSVREGSDDATGQLHET